MKKRLLACLLAGVIGFGGIQITSTGGDGGPNTITVNPGGSITDAINSTLPRITLAGKADTASGMVELTDNDLGQRFLTPSEGAEIDVVCVEGEAQGQITGSITASFETSAAPPDADRASQTVVCTSEEYRTGKFRLRTDEPVTRSNYGEICFRFASRCSLDADTYYWFVLSGDDVYKDGSLGCTGDDLPQECCIGLDSGTCTGFSTGVHSVQFVHVGENNAPCASWTYADGTIPGTHATNCQRGEQSGDNWASLSNADIAFVAGVPQTIQINPGVYRENVDWFGRGLIHINGTPGAILYPDGDGFSDKDAGWYAFSIQRTLSSSINNLTMRGGAIGGERNNNSFVLLTSAIHLEGSSQFTVNNVDARGFSCGVDIAACGGSTPNGEHSRAWFVNNSTFEVSVAGIAGRLNDLGRQITRNNYFILNTTNDASSENIHAGWVCGGFSGEDTQDSMCRSVGDHVYVNHDDAATAADQVAGAMIAPDMNGYVDIYDMHVEVESNSGFSNGTIAGLVSGAFGTAAGPQDFTISHIQGGSFIVRNSSGAGGSENTVGILCNDCNELNVYNAYVKAEGGTGTEAELGISTGGTLVARNTTAENFIALAGTMDVSPAFGTATADGDAETDVTVTGCTTSHSVSCSTTTAACDVAAAYVSAANTVTVTEGGTDCTTGSPTISCTCMKQP